jgi:hypothetical protein
MSCVYVLFSLTPAFRKAFPPEIGAFFVICRSLTPSQKRQFRHLLQQLFIVGFPKKEIALLTEIMVVSFFNEQSPPLSSLNLHPFPIGAHHSIYNIIHSQTESKGFPKIFLIFFKFTLFLHKLRPRLPITDGINALRQPAHINNAIDGHSAHTSSPKQIGDDDVIRGGFEVQ